MHVHDDMKEDFENLANRLLCNSEYQNSLLYLSDICSSTLLPPSIINRILNNLLLENASVDIPNVSVFLQNLLMSFEFKRPCEYQYKAAVLNPSDVFPDLWAILTHLINSSFSHHGINFQQKSGPKHQLVQHPICDLLFHFYVDYILKFLSLKRDLFEDNYDERCITLMSWINVIYKLNLEQIEILKDLHSLLEHTISNKILRDTPLPASVALNQSSLSEAVLKVLNTCEDCFTSSDKVLNFLNNFENEYISASLCYHLLNSMTGRENFLTEKTPVTLKEIVHCFFFVCSSEKEEKYLVKAPKEKVRKKSIEMLTTGDKKLHTLCRKNLFGDLLEVLSTVENLNLNIRNLAQQTPLHIASLYSSHLCVKLLLNSTVSKRCKKVDLTAVDSLSCTPLHYAIIANDIDIVNLLIDHGGKELLYQQDCYGLTPCNYVNSNEMRLVLQKFCPSILPLDGVHCDAETFKVSTIKCTDYSIYLCVLHSFLCYYFSIYHLHEMRSFELVEHGELSCSHFVLSNSNKVCNIDYSFVPVIPKLISEVVEHAKINAKNCETDKQIIQFSLLCDSFMTSVSGFR